VRRELCDLRLRGLLARDGTLANCDFVDWQTGRPRFTDDLRLRGLVATGDENFCAEEKSRVKRAKQKKIPDKNSWVHYFGKCQVKNIKHLEMDLFFLWQNV